MTGSMLVKVHTSAVHVERVLRAPSITHDSDMTRVIVKYETGVCKITAEVGERERQRGRATGKRETDATRLWRPAQMFSFFLRQGHHFPERQ
jgi:hypothetical protein